MFTTKIKFHKVCTDIIQVKWETFALLCGKFIQDTIYQFFIRIDRVS